MTVVDCAANLVARLQGLGLTAEQLATIQAEAVAAFDALAPETLPACGLSPKDLTEAETHVLVALIAHQRRAKEWPRLTDMAEVVGVRLSVIHYHLRKLQAKRVLRRIGSKAFVLAEDAAGLVPPGSIPTLPLPHVLGCATCKGYGLHATWCPGAAA